MKKIFIIIFLLFANNLHCADVSLDSDAIRARDPEIRLQFLLNRLMSNFIEENCIGCIIENILRNEEIIRLKQEIGMRIFENIFRDKLKYFKKWKFSVKSLICYDHRYALKFLIRSGIDVNEYEFSNLDNPNRESPLHYAVHPRIANIEVVKILLDAGININARDINGETALQKAQLHSSDVYYLTREQIATINQIINLIRNYKPKKKKDKDYCVIS